MGRLPKSCLSQAHWSTIRPKLPFRHDTKCLIYLVVVMEAGGIEHPSFHVKQKLMHHAALMLPIGLVIF
jgi:hypothetical protein